MVTKNVTIHKPTLLFFLGLALIAILSATAANAAPVKKAKRAHKKAHVVASSKKVAAASISKAQSDSDRDQMLKRAAPEQKAGVIKQNLSTDMTFNDLNLTGKRQSPFGSQVVVEDEKGMPSLVDYRKNFKDRAEQTQFGR